MADTLGTEAETIITRDRVILTDTKTGAWVRLRAGENADHRARCLGWTDYEVTP